MAPGCVPVPNLDVFFVLMTEFVFICFGASFFPHILPFVGFLGYMAGPFVSSGVTLGFKA